MTNKNKTGRPQDRYIFANTIAGGALLESTQESLRVVGITTEASTEAIEGTTVLVLTVTGKRPGEGRIAADMKTRKA